jgi:hypothetical protein
MEQTMMPENTQPASAPPAGPSAGPPTERNPVTTARFRRESWWQIQFPVLLVTLLAIGVVVALAVWGGADAIRAVSAYSLILLLIPALLVTLLLVGVGGGLVYLMFKLLRLLPPYANLAQQELESAHQWVDRATDRLAGGLIRIRSTLAGINAYLRREGYLSQDDESTGSAGADSPGEPSR